MGGDNGRTGQSEVLGVVLLLAIVLTVTMSVVVVGGAALSDVRSATTTESAELSMSQLRAEIDRLAAGGTERVTFAQPAGGGDGAASSTVDGDLIAVEEDAGEVTVEFWDGPSPGAAPPNRSADWSLGRVVYERDGERLVYQGGGVFRETVGSDAAVTVSPPRVGFRSDGRPTLSLPIARVVVSGSPTESSSASELRLNSTGAREVLGGLPARLDGDDVIDVTVESRHYRAWGRAFEERVGASMVSYDHAAGTTTVTLQGVPRPDTGGGGLAKRAMTTEVTTFEGTNTASVHSYDSDDGPYDPDDAGSRAPVVVDGEFDSNSNFELNGSLTASGRVDVDGGAPGSPSEVGGAVVAGSSPTGPSSLNDRLVVHGPLHVGGDLRLEVNRQTVEGDLHVGGDLLEANEVTVEGDLHVGEDWDVSGDLKRLTVHGDVFVNGSIDDLNNLQWLDIRGNLSVGGSVGAVNWGYDTNIDGDLLVGGTVDPDGEEWRAATDGTVREGVSVQPAVGPRSPDVPPMPSPDALIERKGNEFEGDNDNATAGSTPRQVGRTDASCTPCTLGADGDGVTRYYLSDGIHLKNSERLVFDARSGPIEVYVADPSGGGVVDGSIYLRSDGAGTTPEIQVRGDHRVTLYNRGHVTLEDDTAIETRPQPHVGENVRLYVHSGADMAVNTAGSITGVVNATGADVTLSNRADVFGALSADVDTLPNDVDIHFDRALVDADGGASTSTTSVTMSPGMVEHVRVTTTNVTVGH